MIIIVIPLSREFLVSNKINIIGIIDNMENFINSLKTLKLLFYISSISNRFFNQDLMNKLC